MRDKIKKKRRGTHVKKPNEERMTLTKLAIEMRAGFKQVNSRIDDLEKDAKSLKQDVKSINTRLDKVEKRLDYNDLKQLPTSNK